MTKPFNMHVEALWFPKFLVTSKANFCINVPMEFFKM